MNELCAGLDPAMHFGGALVILEARTPGRSALRHPQIEKIVSCVHVPGQSASLLDRFRPYTDTSLSFRRTLSAGWGGSAGWAHGGGSTGVAHKTEKPADKRAVGGCDRSRIPPLFHSAAALTVSALSARSTSLTTGRSPTGTALTAGRLTRSDRGRIGIHTHRVALAIRHIRRGEDHVLEGLCRLDVGQDLSAGVLNGHGRVRVTGS